MTDYGKMVKLVKSYFRLKSYWKLSDTDKKRVIQSFLDDVQFTFKCDFTVKFVKSLFSYYNHKDKCIALNSLSLMTLLHELRHYFQFLQRKVQRCDIEEDAIYWSHSVFSSALPKLYALSKDKFWHKLDYAPLQEKTKEYTMEKLCVE